MNAKTSHEFARELLLGPDLPICIADHAATGLHNLLHEPKVHKFSGTESPEGGELVEQIEIYATKPAMG